VELEVGIFLLQLAEFGVKDDVLRLTDAVEHGDFGVQLATGGFAGKGAERRHA